MKILGEMQNKSISVMNLTVVQKSWCRHHGEGMRRSEGYDNRYSPLLINMSFTRPALTKKSLWNDLFMTAPLQFFICDKWHYNIKNKPKYTQKISAKWTSSFHNFYYFKCTNKTLLVDIRNILQSGFSSIN